MNGMLTKLEEWPRTPFVREPTPLIQAPNLARLFGRAPEDVLLKMDAESGFGLGGNKARKLEFELAPARLTGATHVITCGGPQSNHARLTAAAAARLGLKCVLVVSGDTSPPHRGNAYLHRLLRRFAPPRGARGVERGARRWRWGFVPVRRDRREWRPPGNRRRSE